MNIAIVGTGYVGLVSGTCFAESGVNVTCIDIDKEKIEKLNQGIMPIYEPGLEEMVERNLEQGRLHFATDLTKILDKVEIIFTAVGTPADEDGSADLHHVLDVARTIGQHMTRYVLVVTKSTVPVGTAQKVKDTIIAEQKKRGVAIEFDVASNPEFLKEGAALKDFMSPDRVVVGTDSNRAKELMEHLYKPFMLNSFRVIFMDIPSAEMTKYAANAMLATRISFMNDIANLCEKVGADVRMVRAGITSDTRIGTKFMYPGCGYGGSCFPKDVKALIHTGLENGCEMRVVQAVESVNDKQKHILFQKLCEHFGSPQDLKGKKIAMWGLSFKPETDDMREAPALILIDALLQAGASIQAYDPIAMSESKRRLGNNPLISYGKDQYAVTVDAHALVIVTEWKTFRVPNWELVQQNMKGNTVIDGRNIYDPKEVNQAGLNYYCIGHRPYRI